MKIMLPPGSLTSTGAINLEWLLYFQSVTQMDPIHLPIIFIGGYMYINIYIYTSSTAQGGGNFRDNYRRGEMLWCMDGRANPLMDRNVVGVVLFGVVAAVTSMLLDVRWCSAVVVVFLFVVVVVVVAVAVVVVGGGGVVVVVVVGVVVVGGVVGGSGSGSGSTSSSSSAVNSIV